MSERDSDIRTVVREYYANAVQAAENCCGPTGVQTTSSAGPSTRTM